MGHSWAILGHFAESSIFFVGSLGSRYSPLERMVEWSFKDIKSGTTLTGHSSGTSNLLVHDTAQVFRTRCTIAHPVARKVSIFRFIGFLSAYPSFNSMTYVIFSSYTDRYKTFHMYWQTLQLIDFIFRQEALKLTHLKKYLISIIYDIVV